MANQHFTDFAPAGGVTVKAFLAEKEAEPPWGRAAAAVDAHPAAAAARLKARARGNLMGTS
jgi:hypothetical protein